MGGESVVVHVVRKVGAMDPVHKRVCAECGSPNDLKA
jgi:hypothetical protein